jgi:hypothetical protein
MEVSTQKRYPSLQVRPEAFEAMILGLDRAMNYPLHIKSNMTILAAFSSPTKNL